MALLALKGVSKSFGALKVTDDVSLSVTQGVVLGILGPNGAGKTTLFNLISGDLQVDAGGAQPIALPVLPGGAAPRSQGFHHGDLLVGVEAHPPLPRAAVWGHRLRQADIAEPAHGGPVEAGEGRMPSSLPSGGLAHGRSQHRIRYAEGGRRDGQ